MFNFLNPVELILLVPALLVAVVVHEFAHAWAADRLGDPTPRIQGRLTLNPLAHLDLLGSLMFLLFRFGWGKPVQFDPYNLENPRRDAAIISFAGPASNLVTAAVLAVITYFTLSIRGIPEIVDILTVRLIQFNVVLAVFNLVPIHPLDGGKVLIGLLPPDTAQDWDRIMQQYGFIILIALVLPIFGTSLIWSIIGPVINFLLGLFLPSSNWI
ncbi:MAG: site-2 protease family protein [Candidatus Blackburnbacteria bacterium]|nr:site-2 protease family protein [Candidatus Blackburnbacteria bacterium]